MPAETGERIWEMMAVFAGYGFRSPKPMQNCTLTECCLFLLQ
jgi:hypothetical protein